VVGSAQEVTAEELRAGDKIQQQPCPMHMSASGGSPFCVLATLSASLSTLYTPYIPHHATSNTKLTPPSQNNNRLDDLASKVSALRGVTIDIYDNARDQGVIDSTVLSPSLPL
jgi:hypothetical protein